MYELSILINLEDATLEELDTLCKPHKALYAIVPEQWVIDVPSLPVLITLAARLKGQGVDFRFCNTDGEKTSSWEMTEATLHKLIDYTPSRFSFREIMSLLQKKMSLGPPK
jgi:hypothetical protein